MWFSKKEKWKKIDSNTPSDIELLLCDENHIWIGKRYITFHSLFDWNYSCWLVRDPNSPKDECVAMSKYFSPTHWQYLPRLPERI